MIRDLSQSLLHNGIKIKSKPAWWSLHIYNFKDFDEILKNYIKPVTEYLYENKHIECLFFIKYADTKGPHLRVRIHAEQEQLEQFIKPYVFLNLFDFFKRPSSFDDYFIESVYEPELARYGGEQGVNFAEKLFELSSNCVLMAYQNSESLCYEKSISLSVQMNYLFGKILLGLTDEKLGSVYQYSMQNWINYVMMYTKTTDEMDDRNKYAKILDHFQKSYNRQKEIMIAIICEMDRISIKPGRKNPLLKSLVKGLTALKTEFEKTRFENYARGTSLSLKDFDTEDKFSLNIFDSYIHMNNNRLGILNTDESFIAYLINSAIKDRNCNSV